MLKFLHVKLGSPELSLGVECYLCRILKIDTGHPPGNQGNFTTP